MPVQLAFDHLRQIGGLLLRRAVGEDRRDRALREARIHGERHVGGRHDLVDDRRHRDHGGRPTCALTMYPGLSAGRDDDVSPRHAGAEGGLPAVEARWTGTVKISRSRIAAPTWASCAPTGVQAGDGQLRDHRHKNLHLATRARSHREHRASGAPAHRGAPAASAARRSHRANFQVKPTARSAHATPSLQLRYRREDGHAQQRHLGMNYDGATGFLIGEENRGIDAMFVMIERGAAPRSARGAGAVGGRLPERRRLCAGSPAGRALSGPKFPERRAGPIIVHPDIAPHARWRYARSTRALRALQ